MAFLVRKLAKRAKLYETYCQGKDVRDLIADIPTSEFKTTNGTLSTWYINDLKDLDNAILAIAVTSSKIEKMDFIIINTSLLDKKGLKYQQTYAGIDIAIPEFQNLHFDILGITLKHLDDCAEIYQEIIVDDEDRGKYIVRVPALQLKKKLMKEIKAGKVNENLAGDKVKDTILKLKKKAS